MGKAAAIPSQVFAHSRKPGGVVEAFKRAGVREDHVEPFLQRHPCLRYGLTATFPDGLTDQRLALEYPRVA